jgi:hypothetical protein
MKNKDFRTREQAEKAIRDGVANCKLGFVPRGQVQTITNGLYTAGTMANIDSEGEGPEGAFYIGRKKCYPVDSFCEWLIARIRV